MSNASDFVIKNGVLVKYKGPGGDVVIPEGVTSIGNHAFWFCLGLAGITIPNSVTSIGEKVFSGCSSLMDIEVAADNTVYHSTGNCLIETASNTLIAGCNTGVIPSDGSVTSIGGWAFSYCGSLTSIVIPDSVTNIGERAFSSCSSLTSITIPDSVTSIGEGAFESCESLNSITIPDSVTSIGDSAFKLCNSLASITIPDGVTSIGDSAFSGCRSLKIITIPDGVTSIGNHAFSGCRSLKIITIPDGVTSIGYDAFSGCASLTSITIPDSVTSIGDSAFSWCASLTSITIPGSVTSIGNGAFKKCDKLTVTLTAIPAQGAAVPTFPKGMPFVLPDGFLRQKNPLPASLATGSFLPDAVDCVYLALFQTAKAWLDKSYLCCLTDEALSTAEELLGEVGKLSPQKVKLLISLLERCKSGADTRLIFNVLAAMKKCAPASMKKTISEFEDKLREKTVDTGGRKRPIEILAEENLKNRRLGDDLMIRAKNGIPYSGESVCCPMEVLALLLAEYADQWTQNAEKISGGMSEVEMLKEKPKVQPSALADEIAASLDRKALLRFLAELAYGNFYRPYILAYVRFADEAEIEKFTGEIEKKKRGHAKERYWAQNAQRALYLSETTVAVRYFERRGGLEYYAEMRGKSVDALRIDRLYNFGFDETGRKVYDLGEKKLSVILNGDLTLSLFDEAASKTVKSIPKRGAAEEKHAAAVEDLAALKKSIKLARTTQFEQLFKAFLHEASRRSDDWKDIYAKNPVFGKIAGLIVWEQNGKTFTLKDRQPIDSAEQPYTIREHPISVAHPMEMQKDEVTAWQQYFAAHRLKQPFAQVWEPVIDFSAVRKDRYSGIELPVYRFMGQEKHGINFSFEYSSGDGWIGLDDCVIACKNGTAFGRHSMDIQGTIILGGFEAKKSRASNHIIGLLDKWTVYGRILKDDTSITEQLPQFTLAQITDFIKLASENDCPNCTAALLEFKNANFADFDPMEEFSLDL